MVIKLDPLKPRDAIKALENRGRRLHESFAWQDVWQDVHAQAFTVAKSTGFDILNDIYTAVQKALNDGQTPQQFAKELTPVLQAKGWWGRKEVIDPETGRTVMAQLGSPRRLQTIFDVNMRVSYAAGHWAAFERTKEARPYLRYVAILDEDTRPQHRARHNLCLPVDHPYWDTWAPPCGWNCRCTLQSLSERDVKQLQAEGEPLLFEPPAEQLVTYLNRRTGVESQVPDGIDPGWAYNPGKAGWLATHGMDKLATAPPELAAGVNDDLEWLVKPATEEFGRWFDLAIKGDKIDRSIVAVGALNWDVLEALAERGILPESAAVTLTQKEAVHMLRDAKVDAGKAVPIDFLRRIPELIARPKAILIDRRDKSLLYVFDVAGESRKGKLAIQIDFTRKARKPGGKPEKITTNSIKTAGLVSERNLMDAKQYDLVFGKI
jgi:SPP1 gp7 family putative phage head morphogenesis protein